MYQFFTSWTMPLVFYLKSHCQPRSLRFSPRLFSRHFIILNSTFVNTPHDPLWVNVCEVYKGTVSTCFFFLFQFLCGCSVVLPPFVEKTIFTPLYCLCSFVKDQLAILMQVYFWVLHSVSLISSIRSSVPCCLNQCSFIEVKVLSWSWGVSVLQLCSSPLILYWLFEVLFFSPCKL